jgi:hypothetical protein
MLYRKKSVALVSNIDKLGKFTRSSSGRADLERNVEIGRLPNSKIPSVFDYMVYKPPTIESNYHQVWEAATGPTRPANEIYNAKLSNSFTSQLKGRLYLFSPAPYSSWATIYRIFCLFVHLLHSQHGHNVVYFGREPNRPTLDLLLCLIWYSEGNERFLSRMFNHCTVEALLMRWLKRDIWKASIAVAGVLLLLVLMVWVPMSSVGAYEGALGLATPTTGTVQVTPVANPTIAAETAKEQLRKLQLDNERSLNAWFWNNAASILSALVLVGGALIGLWRWTNDRRDAQDKELKDRLDERVKRSEERFRRIVTDLGSERKEARIAAAIMLLTFLQPGYEQFYRQIFDFAVAYLQPLRVDTTTSDFVPLDPLRQALINVFKQSFLCVRGEWDEQKSKSRGSDPSDHDRLGAVGIQLDGAYLVKADLRDVWMREASLRKAHLFETKLTGAHLKGADFTDAYLRKAILIRTDCSRAIFTRAKLMEADFAGADISRADFTGADLTRANPEAAALLKDAKMSSVVGLMPEQRDACVKAGASFETPPRVPTASIVKRWSVFYRRKAQSVLAFLQKLLHAAAKELLASASFDSSNQSTASDTNSSSSFSPSQSSDVQAPSAPPAQGSPPTPDTGGSSGDSSSQPGSES